MSTSDERSHIAPLDGLRGAAACVVFFSHFQLFGLMQNRDGAFLGGTGVAVFFTLSGFLMSYLYLSRTFSFSSACSYAVSRFARIAPVYLFVVCASYAICATFDPQFIYAIDNHNLLRHLLFLGNVSVLWSIPPEVQFYVFFLLLWWATTQLAQRVFWPAAFVAGLTVLMLTVSQQVPGTTLPSKLSFFLLGTLVGLIRSRHPYLHLSPVVLGGLQFAALVLLIVFGYRLFNHEAMFASPLYILLSAVTVLLLSYGGGLGDILLGNPMMRTLGTWSFSLYLLHAPVLQAAERLVHEGELSQIAAIAGSVVVVLAISFASYSLIEKPCQFALRSLAGRLTRAFRHQTEEPAG
ncbi:acyltransferase family protein [Magnetospirillum fulvum]|uniref:Peptidoglycan/LPS O-acetylase OafA/YrhL, contains acyltransferase and SGNH-hydrolase domains n=1 Tax=Magnetospirillum fulvum TaxID=1082 RepID=A0A1H6HF19_MAGFU|nr:acyltransferase [Magnetospirillum fulvum]SEH32690.1 Peptidoglycan/LPS O-acetylase OafA/YrhL, contains acyltransferase and SGNH-hydrolase domains [Magnetospirillum fulvum]